MTLMVALLLAAAPIAAAPSTKASAFDKPVPEGKVSVANPRSIISLMQDEGYKAKLVIEDEGNPYIESSADGANFYVQLTNCKDGRECQDAMFRSSYDKDKDKPTTLEAINSFNGDRRWVRAYLDKEGGPVIEQDLLFTDQIMDKKMFKEALEIWADGMSRFHDVIEF